METTENKVMGVISYLGVLVIIPILIGPKDAFVRNHINQGLVLCIIRTMSFIIIRLIGWIPIVGGLLEFMLGFIEGLTLVCAIVGIIYAVLGRTIKFPIIGDIELIH